MRENIKSKPTKWIEKKVIAVFKNFARPIGQIFTIFFCKMPSNIQRDELHSKKLRAEPINIGLFNKRIIEKINKLGIFPSSKKIKHCETTKRGLKLTLMRKKTQRKQNIVLLLLPLLSVAFLSFAPVKLQAAPENRPYDAGLLRLSEILGAVHYLRALCGINDELIWRDKMQDLIKAEGVTSKRKAKLTKSFNKGYKSFQRTYRRCTPSAKTAINLFLDEGIELSEKLVTTNQ